MSKIYIAGRIAGEPAYKELFAAEADRQRAAGHVVLNPAELPVGMSPADYMRICLAMIDAADKVVLLPNYQQSPGARLEREYCQYTGKPVECLEQEEGDSQRAEGSKDIYLTEEAMVRARKEIADVSVMLDQMEEIFGDSWGEYLAATDHLVKLLADGKDEQ